MTKAESAASRTQKTHFADDETLAHIAALELEAADLRSCIKDLRERLAKARKDATTVKEMLELGDTRLMAGDGPCGGQLPQLSPDEWGKVYRACKRIIKNALAHPKGEDHGNG